MMKRQGEHTIQTCLTKMSNIINATSDTSRIAKTHGFSALTKSINQLSASGFDKPPPRIDDLVDVSLGKVNYYIELALNRFESIRASLLDKEQQMNILFALGETFETLGNYEGALRNYQALLSSSKDQSMKGQLQYRIGRIHVERGNWERASSSLIEAVQILQSVGLRNELVLAQIELAKIAYRRGAYSKANDVFQAALELSKALNDIRSRATVSNHLGIIRRIWGEYDAAYDHFHRALIESQSIQDLRGAAESMNNLGVVHLKRQELPPAQDYFEKAQQLCQETGYFVLLAFVYLNKAEYYCEFGDGPMAANFCHQALEYIVRLRNPIGIAKINMLFGRIFRRSGDTKTAEEFYKTSMYLYEEFSIPLGLANCYREYAQMLKETDNGEAYAIFHTKAEEIFDELSKQMKSEKTG